MPSTLEVFVFLLLWTVDYLVSSSLIEGGLPLELEGVPHTTVEQDKRKNFAACTH